MAIRRAEGWRFGVRLVLAAILLAAAPQILLAHSDSPDASVRATHPLHSEPQLEIFESAKDASDDMGHALVLFDVPLVVAPEVVALVDDGHAPRRLTVFSHVTPRRGPPRV